MLEEVGALPPNATNACANDSEETKQKINRNTGQTPPDTYLN
jgi:hypothetical protein